MQPKDLPPWLRVHQLMQRWFKAVGHDLRTLLRLVDGRSPHPSGLEISERSGAFQRAVSTALGSEMRGVGGRVLADALGSVQLNIHFLLMS